MSPLKPCFQQLHDTNPREDIDEASLFHPHVRNTVDIPFFSVRWADDCQDAGPSTPRIRLQEYGQDGPYATCKTATRSENVASGRSNHASVRQKWRRSRGGLRSFSSQSHIIYFVFFNVNLHRLHLILHSQCDSNAPFNCNYFDTYISGELVQVRMQWQDSAFEPKLPPRDFVDSALTK